MKASLRDLMLDLKGAFEIAGRLSDAVEALPAEAVSPAILFQAHSEAAGIGVKLNKLTGILAEKVLAEAGIDPQPLIAPPDGTERAVVEAAGDELDDELPEEDEI